MVVERLDRLMPGPFCGLFFKALENQVGIQGLQLVLSGCGLGDLIPPQMPSGGEIQMFASQFAVIQSAIRQYYGSGARGVLIRVGRQLWQEIFRSSAEYQKFKFFLAKLSSPDNRCQMVLNYLAQKWDLPANRFSIHSFIHDVIFVDLTSDSTFDQSDEKPICWVTTGVILEAVSFALGKEIDVEEFSCLAAGGEACKFRIQL